jgi:hypothetical protein
MESTLQAHLEKFYDVNGYGEEGGIKNDWIWLKFKFFSLPIPNIKGRRENVWRHDMLHILLDYDTSWKGETQVSGWVMGSGGWGRFYVGWLFAIAMFTIAIVFFPKLTFQAFVRGRNTKSPYLLGIKKEELYRTNIEELKHNFGFDRIGLKENLIDIILFIMWALLAIISFLLPFAILAILFLQYK